MKVVSFKCMEEDHETWKGEARRLGVGFSEWVRRKLNDNPLSVAPALVREATKPKGSRCTNRVPPGAYCKRCAKIHK